MGGVAALTDADRVGAACTVFAALSWVGLLTTLLVAGAVPARSGSIVAATLFAGVGVVGFAVAARGGKPVDADHDTARNGGVACHIASVMLAVPLPGLFGIAGSILGVTAGIGGGLLVGAALEGT